MNETVLTPIEKARQKIKFVSERELYIKGLIYGDPGAGKTWLVGTVPNVLLLLTEPEIARPTLLALRRERGIDVPTWDILTGEDLLDAYEFLASGQHEFQAVAIDGLTDLNTRIKQAVLSDSVERAAEKGRWRDPEAMEQGDWGRLGDRTMDWVRKFRDLPMHVFMTALATEIRGEMKLGPLIQPRSAAALVRANCNLVGYLDAVEVDGLTTRKLVLQDTALYAAKNPGNVLPTMVENPDMMDIVPRVVRALTNGKEVA